MSAATRGSAGVVLLLFAGSGCAALIYELVWFHLLGIVIGASAILIRKPPAHHETRVVRGIKRLYQPALDFALGHRLARELGLAPLPRGADQTFLRGGSPSPRTCARGSAAA